jgi:hypothetical protein
MFTESFFGVLSEKLSSLTDGPRLVGCEPKGMVGRPGGPIQTKVRLFLKQKFMIVYN